MAQPFLRWEGGSRIKVPIDMATCEKRKHVCSSINMCADSILESTSSSSSCWCG